MHSPGAQALQSHPGLAQSVHTASCQPQPPLLSKAQLKSNCKNTTSPRCPSPGDPPAPGVLLLSQGKMKGNGYKLLLRRFQLITRQKVFTMRTTSHWNILPREVVDSPALDVFRIWLDRMLGILSSPRICQDRPDQVITEVPFNFCCVIPITPRLCMECMRPACGMSAEYGLVFLDLA